MQHQWHCQGEAGLGLCTQQPPLCKGGDTELWHLMHKVGTPPSHQLGLNARIFRHSHTKHRQWDRHRAGEGQRLLTVALQGTQRGQPFRSAPGDSKATGCRVGGGLQECCRSAAGGTCPHRSAPCHHPMPLSPLLC